MPVFPGAGDASVRLAYQDAGGVTKNVDTDNPLPVDIQGASLSLDANGVEIKNDAGNPIPVNDAGGSITVDGTVNTLTGLEIPSHDYAALSYTGSNLTTIVYKTGGSGGTTVATVTLGYDGSNNLTSITKS